MLGVLHGSSYALITIAFQRFFDSVTQVVEGLSPLSLLYGSLVLLGTMILAKEVIHGVHNFMAEVLIRKVLGHLSWRIHEKASRIEPISFENSEFLDEINKAKEGALNSLVMVLIGSSIVMFYLPYFLFMTVYLYRLKPILVLTIFLAFIPLAITQFIRGSVFTELEDEVAPLRREFDYYERCLVHREYFKETRTLGAFPFLRSLYFNALQTLQKKQWTAELKTGLLELAMKLISLVGYGSILYLLISGLLQGDLSVGSFAAVFGSLGLMFGLLEEIVVRHFGTMSRNMGTVRNFIRFLDLPERQGVKLPVNLGDGVIVKNVSFTYPGASGPCLENVNLEIKKGETLAIVGHNGAGKTTLVRLLTGLYVPTVGEVLISGLNTKEIEAESLFQGVSAVFQKFQRYQMSLEENVSISQMAKKSQGDIDEALAKAELVPEPSTFPDGLQTMLSREFDGVDLSGGQWQRVAIARGFYRSHDFIVLDEPTAAIDPLEETRLYKQFEEMSHGKTAILVTHRLGSARVADRIVVLDRGKIVAIGTHAELLAASGKYAEMYEAQAQWYYSEQA